MRLAGQDSRRGTFGQRHSVLVDRTNGAEHTPLKTLRRTRRRFYVYDSLLSEFAAMGFEYGYSVARPDALVLWEAQFGDFADGAQSIIDEFISSGEEKWGQHSGVTLLLPHGYEGQGPDHSSARIERYLQLCAEDNMTVAMPSTPGAVLPPAAPAGARAAAPPADRLHPEVDAAPAGRRVGGRDFTTRHLAAGHPRRLGRAGRARVLLCSRQGLLRPARRPREARSADSADDVALVRVEQLYPTPVDEVSEALASYGVGSGGTTDVAWVQEEPANQGAWPHVSMHLTEDLPEGVRLRRVSRSARLRRPRASPRCTRRSRRP